MNVPLSLKHLNLLPKKNVCSNSSGNTICFDDGGDYGAGLGDPTKSQWSPLNGDWTSGSTSINTDMGDDYPWCASWEQSPSVTVKKCELYV